MSTNHFLGATKSCVFGDGIHCQTLNPVCSYYTHHNPLKLWLRPQSWWSCKSWQARYNCPENKTIQKLKKKKNKTPPRTTPSPHPFPKPHSLPHSPASRPPPHKSPQPPPLLLSPGASCRSVSEQFVVIRRWNGLQTDEFSRSKPGSERAAFVRQAQNAEFLRT